MMMVKDWRGNEIKVGSKIIWPGRSGSSMWMTEGEVVEIQTKKEEQWIANSIQEVDVPILKVKSGSSTNFFKNPTDKLSTIHVIERVTVIPEVSQPVVMNQPVEPLEIPQFPTEANITWTMGSSLEPLPPAPTVKESLEAIKLLVEQLPSAERKQLTRDLIRKSINLNLKDFKDI